MMKSKYPYALKQPKRLLVIFGSLLLSPSEDEQLLYLIIHLSRMKRKPHENRIRKMIAGEPYRPQDQELRQLAAKSREYQYSLL